MALLQKALETYDAMERLAGIYEEGKEPLAPIGHIVTKAQLEVTIDADGRFVSARPADKDKKIIIPVTEKSGGRSGTVIAPHPLCDKLDYLLGEDADKLETYLRQLTAWAESTHGHIQANAVLKYMQQGTLCEDLTGAGLSTEKEKDMICWRVVGCGVETSSAVWKDISLMQAYTAWYLSQQQGEKQLCMLTGEKSFMQSVFVQRPGYAAKLIIDQLKTAYYPLLSVCARIHYDRLIGEIMEQLSQFGHADYNTPLTETYLPGYYLQKNAFYTKKSEEETEEE